MSYFVLQRLKALDDGWEDLRKMWESKQNLLSQSLNLQMFMRDAKQAEVLLSQQDNFLSKEEVPVGFMFLFTICVHLYNNYVHCILTVGSVVFVQIKRFSISRETA